MTLLVTETSYRRNAADAVPLASQWPWKLPRTGTCGDDDAWNRSDLVHVRHLLSGARLQAAPDTPDTDYYLQLVRAAGCSPQSDGVERPCSFSKVRVGFLEPFVASMHVNYRREGLNYEQGPWPVNEAFPLPAESLTHIPVEGSNLGGWLTAMTSVQTADFFNFALPPTMELKDIDVGELCARLGNRRDAQPAYVSAGKTTGAGVRTASALHALETAAIPVCQFNLKRLSFKPGRWWPAGPPAVGSEVDLLSSSDPLMLFRPPAHRKMLDSSGRRLCPPGTPGDTTCSEDERLSQGFVDFDTLIELQVDGQREPMRVPASMSVAQFERKHGGGMKVVSLKRQGAWLPQQFVLVELNTPRRTRELPTASLVTEQGLTLHFMSEQSEEWRVKSGIYILDPMKTHVILAPGDRITLTR
jgi:hypothetical protein